MIEAAQFGVDRLGVLIDFAQVEPFLGETVLDLRLLPLNLGPADRPLLPAAAN